MLKAMQPFKQQHPGLFIWLNEGGTTWTANFSRTNPLPAEIDIISIDDYSMTVNYSAVFRCVSVCILPHKPASTNLHPLLFEQPEQHKTWYQETLYSIMTDKQAAFIVPGLAAHPLILLPFIV